MSLSNKSFDVIIIGGGAIGSNIALESSLRGLKTLLIEQNDFASGTSSKSTKLLHGGVRYLEKAFKNLDIKQYNLVVEALEQRSHFLKNAPHLCQKLRFQTFSNNIIESIYYYLGLKIYDLLSSKKTLGKTSYTNENEISKINPFINKAKIKSSINYFDGSFNDAKLVIDILKTAQEFDASILNYTKLERFLYEDEKLIGIKVKDNISQKESFFYSPCIINASGHYVNELRKLDNKNAKEIVSFSKGSHIVIKKELLSLKEAVLIPNTKDKRVIFLVPWLDYCLIGTTEIKTKFEENSKISQEEIEFLLSHVNAYFTKEIKKEDILSSWSALRTLLKEDGSSKDIVREHIFEISKSNLISVCGGKWTTSANIAKQCFEKIEDESLIYIKKPSKIHQTKINGFYDDLQILEKNLAMYTLEESLKKHLINTYGQNSIEILKIAKEEKAFEKICENEVFIKAELLYCIRYEYVKKTMDFLARRLRLAFLDKKTCLKALEKVSEIIANEVYKNESLKEKLQEEAKKELDEFF